MLTLLFPLVLSTQVLGSPLTFVETIRISDSLVIRSEYKPQGTVLTSEAMTLTVEDFGTLQAEVENSTGACNLRLKDLKRVHSELLEDTQKRCTERNKAYKSDLDAALKVNAELEEALKKERKALSTQKWINLGIVIGGTVLTAVVLYQ